MRTIVRMKRTSCRQLIDWLFPRVRKKVLTLLLMDAQRRWHLRDIVRTVGCGVSTVRRELTGLTACGIVTATRDGNRLYYQASTACPIYVELASLIRKTSGLADVLRAAMETLGPRVRVVFVYGSQALHDVRSSSDVDVMVIGEAGFGEVVNALHNSQETIGREINPTVYSTKEFCEKVSAGHHFLRAVLNGPKLFLIGNNHELGELAKQRVESQ